MWYNKIINDLNEIPNFINYYEKELVEAKKCVNIYGNIEQNLAKLPGQTEMYFSMLQEIEAILNYMNIQLRKIRRTYYQQYLEGYNRALTSRDCDKYVDGETDVIDYELLINSVALIRNKYLGIMKGLESKGFQLSSISRLRCAGMESTTL